MTEETTLREDIEKAITEVNEPENVEVSEVKEDRPRDETGKFKAKEETVEEPVKEAPVVNEKPKIQAPASWSASVKAKWDALDPEVQAEIARREEETHKGFTKLDEERNLGKSMKDVITPYMHIIKAEGGTPEKAVADLLNTAYLLRTAPPAQKAAMVQQICQTYGVDLSHVTAQPEQDPTIAQLQQKIAQLEQMANPDALQKRLQEQLEVQQINSEVQAFASNPENVHYEKVKAVMAALLSSGAAQNMKEAYDAACRADPTIFSTLEAKRLADEQAKKNAELAAKKKAAVSLTGSPGATVPNTGAPNRDLREELLANLRAATS